MCRVKRDTVDATSPRSSHFEPDPATPGFHLDPPSSSPVGAVSPGTADGPGGDACLH